jgi:Mg/Co/Ni transporter MgtE
VYDYAPGKEDWLAAGLPTQGEKAGSPRAGTVARRDVPVCAPGEPMAQVRRRVEESGWEACVVIDADRVVLGLLRAEQLATGRDDQVAEAVMRPGPSTFRAHVPIEHMAHYMADHDMRNCPITTPEGRLIGLLRREDAAKAAPERAGAGSGHVDDD